MIYSGKREKKFFHEYCYPSQTFPYASMINVEDMPRTKSINFCFIEFRSYTPPAALYITRRAPTHACADTNSLLLLIMAV